MKFNDNIILMLQAALENPADPKWGSLLQKPENIQFIETLLERLLALKAQGQPFVIFFQPGAMAPIQDYKPQWMEAGLGGCTDELCEIAKLGVNCIVINSMTADEQHNANLKISADRLVDVSKLVLNDPDQVLAKIFEMTVDDSKKVNTRSAYVPQALVCTIKGHVHGVIKNPLPQDAQARKSNHYLEQVKIGLGFARSPATWLRKMPKNKVMAPSIHPMKTRKQGLGVRK